MAKEILAVPEHGDSWKYCDIEHLRFCVDRSMVDWFDNPDNTNHLIDVANFCAMLVMRTNNEEEFLLEKARYMAEHGRI